jgi:glycine cleavage system aminomethyltransferase T
MKSLQDLIDSTPNLVDHFYNDTISPFHVSRNSLFAQYIAPEYTNWREEQKAWRESAVLFDQSHHMPGVFIKGPDATKMMNYLGVNSFANLSTHRAKQFIMCSPSGHVIGDVVMYYYGEDEGFEINSSVPGCNWVRYHAQTGEFDVTAEFDPTTPFNPTGRRVKYRFQLEGPNARAIMEKVVEGDFPHLKFFNTGTVRIAGCDVLLLRHGMSGNMGVEISGPYDDMETVRSAILEAGADHGIKRGGTRAYFSTVLENGWMSYPVPGIFTGEELRAYREWLPADGWEANVQLGGSLYTDNIEDYYQTPWDMGYQHIVKFDHDFIGREALEASLAKPRRTKRTLLWNREDVLNVFASQFEEGATYKSIEFPTSYFGWPQADEVLSSETGERIGMSCHCGYNYNEKSMLSLVSIDEDHAEIGTEVTLVWGEVNGGSRKPHVEPHEQVRIRATVCPAPYASSTRERLRSTV